MPEVCSEPPTSEAAVLPDSQLQQWYALRVRSRHEKSVFAQLVAKQHEAFLPSYNARHKWVDRWKTVSMPLFPGYVFCRFDAALRTSVLTTSGVIDVVRAGSQPAAVDSAEIDAIRVAVNSPLFTEPYAGLIKGQGVVVTGGPLAGLTGHLVEMRKNLRLVLSVELLSRSVLVEIDRDWVAPRAPVRSLANLRDSNSRSSRIA
jgi:transcription antitermination factor NusG